MFPALKSPFLQEKVALGPDGRKSTICVIFFYTLLPPGGDVLPLHGHQREAGKALG